MYSCVMLNNDYIAGRPAVYSRVCFSSISEMFFKYSENAVASYIALDEKTDDTISKSEIPNDESDSIFVFSGAFPFCTADTLDEVYNHHVKSGNKLTVLSCKDEETGELMPIGIFLCDKSILKNFIDFDERMQQAIDDGIDTELYEVNSINSMCVSDCLSLADASNAAHDIVCFKLMQNDVMMINPESIFVSWFAEIAPGVTIMPNTIIKGESKIGTGSVIGPNTQITDCTIGENVTVNSSVLVESVVKDGANIGPFAYIRPNSSIGNNVKIGDFVEIKNASIDDGTKVAHLTYVGDADVGKRVNFGCGTVLVNYDGTKKYRSKICDDVFIGCNTNLVSPVTVHRGAFIAAGSTITDDIPDNSLAIARARQINKTGWKKKWEEKK